MPVTNRLQRSLRATFLGMASNVVLSAAKLAAGIVGHSHALVADAVESLRRHFQFASSSGAASSWRRSRRTKTIPTATARPSRWPPPSCRRCCCWRRAGLRIEALQRTSPNRGPRRHCSRCSSWSASWWSRKACSGLCRARRRGGQLRRASRRLASSQRRHHVRGGGHRHQHGAHRRQGLRAADDVAAIAAAGVIAWNGWRLLRPAFNELMDTAPDREIIERKSGSWRRRFPAWRAWKNVSSARWATSFTWTCTWRWTRK